MLTELVISENKKISQKLQISLLRMKEYLIQIMKAGISLLQHFEATLKTKKKIRTLRKAATVFAGRNHSLLGKVGGNQLSQVSNSSKAVQFCVAKDACGA